MGGLSLESMLSYLKGPDIIRIKDKETGLNLYQGYKGQLHAEENFMIMNGVKGVKEYRVRCEITHKEWRKRGLLAPMLPEALPQYQFRDMQVNLIHEFYV